MKTPCPTSRVSLGGQPDHFGSGAQEHSDSWIALKLHTQLLRSVEREQPPTTTINVKDGVVTLTGTADNQAQKDLTGVYAKEIDWVKSVKTISSWNEKPTMGETMGEHIDDASITSPGEIHVASPQIDEAHSRPRSQPLTVWS